MTTKATITAVVAILFIIGAGYIIYKGRPVMNMEQTVPTTSQAVQVTNPSIATTTTATPDKPTATTTDSTKPTSKPAPAPSPTPEPAPAPNTFTMTDIQAHGTPSSCWAAVGGNVYDLTSWISRHPGGPGTIQRLCGTDATARFERKHGDSSSAKAMLALLKIWTLR